MDETKINGGLAIILLIKKNYIMKKCNHESCNQEHSSTTSQSQNSTNSMFNSTNSFFQKNESTNSYSAFGRGTPTQAKGFAQSLSLEGLTEAEFDGGSFSVTNAQQTEATECENCGDSDCRQISGVLDSTFHVNTNVTLPNVDDLNLTPCQVPIVTNAINNVLAPHEQDHVRRFSTYNGSVSTPFNVKVCSGDFSAKMQEMHDNIESARQSAAQALSDEIDPFNFDVDIDCED